MKAWGGPWLCAGVLLAPWAVPSALQGETPPAQEPIGPPVPPPAPRYHSAADLETLLRGWLGSGLSERLTVGTSAGGRELVGVVFGGKGQLPLGERPTVFLVGGLDGVSLSGAEAVVRVTEELLAAPERLPPDIAFLAVPFANPDGLARTLATATGDGRNDSPSDEDGDGAMDEDGPDAMDDDGQITSLLIEDRDGPWARAEDDRLLRPARPGDAPRYALAREGRDDDGDGRFNEDGPGGIVPDQDFPVDWRGPWTGAPSGPWPLASPEARALADLVLARRTALVLLFQGAHGGLALPGGVNFAAAGAGPAGAPGSAGTPILAPDRVAFELAGRRFAAATGRAERELLRLCEARGAERPGAMLDWVYLARGALALEVAAWGPSVEDGKAHAQDARFEGAAEEQGLAPSARRASALDRAWARWLDDTRGGIGFLDWQPIELGGGRSGLIGGWLPRTRENPPDELLATALRGLGDFVRTLAHDLPHLEIEVSELSRSGGDVCVLRARVRNRGSLPTGVGVGDGALGAMLRLELQEGVKVLVGEQDQPLGHLAGGGASPELSWVLMIPESAALSLRVETPWLAPVVREVRP